MPREYAIAAAILAAIALGCGLSRRTTRHALLQGFRCMGRYPDLWRIPALFGLGYAFFDLAAAALLHLRMQDFGTWIFAIEQHQPPNVMWLLPDNALPAIERTASVFTIFTATFPLSALFAALLLLNFRGMLAEMVKSLRKRLGRWRGILVTVFLVFTALCAIAKPVAFLLLPEIEGYFALILVIDFFSTIFELLLGIFFLTYLMLMAYAWMRGLFFQRSKLLHVAMRRAGFVLKWSLLLAALAAVFILLPLHLGILFAPDEDLQNACVWFSTWIGHGVVTAVALLYCPVQAILVFHNESLREALRDGRRLLRAQWTSIIPFLATGCALFILLLSATECGGVSLGTETSAAFGIRIFTAFLESLLAGWLIASWVCLYRSLSAGRKEIPF
jgi:hypothetical protein